MENLSILTATIDEQIELRVHGAPRVDDALAPISGRGQDVRERLQLSRIGGGGGKVIRTHGDFHLGQTDAHARPRLGGSWTSRRDLPAGSLPRAAAEDAAPLRDIAGMLPLVLLRGHQLRDPARQAGAPADWEDRARETFLEGYFETGRRRPAPAGPAGHDAAAGGVRAREGGLRAALRAQQPPRLGRRSRSPASSGCSTTTSSAVIRNSTPVGGAGPRLPAPGIRSLSATSMLSDAVHRQARPGIRCGAAELPTQDTSCPAGGTRSSAPPRRRPPRP